MSSLLSLLFALACAFVLPSGTGVDYCKGRFGNEYINVNRVSEWEDVTDDNGTVTGQRAKALIATYTTSGTLEAYIGWIEKKLGPERTDITFDKFLVKWPWGGTDATLETTTPPVTVVEGKCETG